MTDEKRRTELRAEIASLLTKIDPISLEMMTITQRAQTEGWDVQKWTRARAGLQAKREALGELAKVKIAELNALDPDPPAPPAALEVRRNVPTFVRYTRIEGDLAARMAMLEPMFERWNCGFTRVIPLRTSKGPDSEGGLEYIGPPADATTLPEVLAAARRSDLPFALVCSARAPRAPFSLVFFDRAKLGFALSVGLNPRLVAYEDEKLPQGRWLDGLLTSIVEVFEPLACSYGTTPPGKLDYTSVDPAALVTSLRSGELLALPRPVLHAISTSLVTLQEVQAILAAHAPEVDPAYRLAPGYHLFGRTGV